MSSVKFSIQAALGALLVTLAPHATAAPDYQCMIQKVVMTPNQSAAVLRQAEQEYMGKQFTVERRTGLMAGAVKNSYITKPVVIDMGSAENSYKVVTTLRREEGTGYGSNIYALTINEYEKSPKKAFIFMENDVVYTGQCVHFQ